MINYRVKILGDNINSSIYRNKRRRFIVDKNEQTEEFINRFLDDEIYRYGMKQVKGVNNKFKFVIHDRNGNSQVIENVGINDPCFPKLNYASTIKIDIKRRIKGAIILASLATVFTFAIKGDDMIMPNRNEPINLEDAITKDVRNYKIDYEQMRRYYIKLIKSEITNPELMDFLEIVNYYLDRGNLSEEDEMVFKRYKYEIEAYSITISTIVNEYRK